MNIFTYGAARRMIAVSVFSTTICGAIPFNQAQAQDAEYPSNAVAYPGQIVYSRDVPYGIATRRFDQGEAHTVSPDQSVLIANSLLIGLEPLSDAEQALVSAPLSRGLDATQSALLAGLSALSSAAMSEGDFNSAGGGADGIGGIISNSLSALPSALGMIGKVLGDGQ